MQDSRNVIAMQLLSISEALTEFLILVALLYVWFYRSKTFEAISLWLLCMLFSKMLTGRDWYQRNSWASHREGRSKPAHGWGKDKCITDYIIIFCPIIIFSIIDKTFFHSKEKHLLITILSVYKLLY